MEDNERDNNIDIEEQAAESGTPAQEAPPDRGTRPPRIRFILIGFVTGILSVCIAAYIFLARDILGTGIDYIGLVSKMQTIDHLIDRYYLYDADPDEMEEGVFLGLMYGLGDDDYAEYYSPAAYEEVDEQQNGSYVGIGISVTKDGATGGIRIEDVNADGPADMAGLKAGDIIILAGGTDLREMDLDTAVGYMRGEEGTSVEITFLRDGEEMSVIVTRETIVTTESVHDRIFTASEIPGARMGSLRVGYISIGTFIRTTEADFEEAYERLVYDEEVDGLIIDLRNNVGGDLNVCLNMLKLIISPSDEIVYESDTPYTEGDVDADMGALLLSVEDKSGEKVMYYSDEPGSPGMPVVVLVNSRSASASEIFAGVLRDYGYTILGTRTFGKGIVQSVISLSDGSAVKFTTDQYRLPAGDYIHGVGIEPEIELQFVEYDEVTERSVNYASGAEEPDMLRDNQIKAAVDIIEEEAYMHYQETA